MAVKHINKRGLGIAGLGLSRSLSLCMLLTVIGGMDLPPTLPQASLAWWGASGPGNSPWQAPC